MKTPNNILTITFLVGPSGSGKTTYAQDVLLQDPDYQGFVYLSSDKLREVLTGSESDQSKNGLVFMYLKAFCEYCFVTNQSVILDATNYNKKNRRDFVNLAKKYNARTLYYVFLKPKDLLIENNQKRSSRVVPVDVIERQLAGFEGISSDEVVDGWARNEDPIIYIYNNI